MSAAASCQLPKLGRGKNWYFYYEEETPSGSRSETSLFEARDGGGETGRKGMKSSALNVTPWTRRRFLVS